VLLLCSSISISIPASIALVEDNVRAALAHELAHVERHDAVALAAVFVVAACLEQSNHFVELKPDPQNSGALLDFGTLSDITCEDRVGY
jgi:beta-lactamase regulating signal transducer with metallopeptidase domain